MAAKSKILIFSFLALLAGILIGYIWCGRTLGRATVVMAQFSCASEAALASTVGRNGYLQESKEVGVWALQQQLVAIAALRSRRCNPDFLSDLDRDEMLANWRLSVLFKQLQKNEESQKAFDNTRKLFLIWARKARDLESDQIIDDKSIFSRIEMLDRDMVGRVD